MARILASALALAAFLPFAPGVQAKEAPPPWPDDPAAVEKPARPDGSRSWEVRRADGTRTDYRTWPDGSRRWEFHYDAKHKEHGTCTRWHKTGAVFVEERWEHGVRRGTWYYDNEDGTRNARFTFEDGREVSHETWSKPHGEWIPFEGPKAFPTP